MGGTACKAKVIMNGGAIQDAAARLCYQVEEAQQLPDEAGYKIVGLLNTAEDAVLKAQRVFLESQGFNGPWPKSLA